MTEPLFSIILPTYNRAHLIQKAIESVISQSFSNWELIIIDDGSTDNTKDIVALFKDNRITYLYQENAERSAARNTGIRLAKGEQICFLDSDDYYLPTRLMGLKSFIDNCTKKTALFYTAAMIDRSSILTERGELIRGSTSVFDFIINATIATPQACIHKDIIKENLFDPRFRIGEDMELWLRIVESYPLMFIPNQATIIQTEHEDRSVGIGKLKPYQEHLATLEYVFSLKYPIHKSLKKKKLHGVLMSIARCYFYVEKNNYACRKTIIRCFSYSFFDSLKEKVYLFIKSAI